MHEQISRSVGNWIRKNITGERGSGYISDFGPGGNETEDKFEQLLDAADDVPTTEAGTTAGQTVASIGSDLITGVIFDVAKKVLGKIVRS